MVTLTIHTPSCRTLRNCNSLILRGVLVCAALWLFITAKDVLRRRREACNGARYRPRGDPDQRTQIHASDNLVLDHVQHPGEDRRRLATTPEGSTTAAASEEKITDHLGQSHKELEKHRRHAREQHRQPSESHDSDTKRSDKRSSHNTVDDVAWDDVRRRDSNSEGMTDIHQKRVPHPKHERTRRYMTTDGIGYGDANSEMDTHRTENPDVEIRREKNEQTSTTSRESQHKEDGAHHGRKKIKDHRGTKRAEDVTEEQLVGTTEQPMLNRPHPVIKHSEGDEEVLQGHDLSVDDYHKADGDPTDGDQSQEAGDAYKSTTSSEALFTIANDSTENDALYYHHNLPPIIGLLLDGQEEKYPLADHTVRICSQKQRQLHLRETCHDVFDEKRERRTYQKRRVKLVAINHQYKLLYCMLPKTGTRSWLTFLVNLTSNAKAPARWNIRDAQFMDRMGIEYRRNLHLDELESRYKDYTRLVVVRHPLQRFASAYYESVVKNGKFKNKDGTLPSFRLFATMFATGRLRPHVQMARYINHCQVCRIKYDYLLKAETLPSDFHLIRSDLGTNVPLPREHVNKIYKGRHHTDVFKYDALLKTLYPDDTDVLKGLMSVYEVDNKIFGYGWDFEKQRSTCSAVQGDKPYPCC